MMSMKPIKMSQSITIFCCKLVIAAGVYIATLLITTILLILNVTDKDLTNEAGSSAASHCSTTVQQSTVRPSQINSAEAMKDLPQGSFSPELSDRVFWIVSVSTGAWFAWKAWSMHARKKELARLHKAVAEHEKSRRAQFASLKQSLLSEDSDLLVRREGIVHIPVPELLEALKNNEFTAVEVLEAYQWAALKAQQITNCVCVFIDDARKVATNLDFRYEKLEPELKPPLFGLPFSIKENIQVKGHRNTCGFAYSLISEQPAESDGIWISQIKAMGGVPFVRTNVPISMLSLSCSNPIYGVTCHPQDPKRTSGGSSGGEAALVAFYGSALGIGSDVGGSIRVPAHFCGIAGFKPTSRRSTCSGGVGAISGLPAGPYSSRGPIARDVETLALFMQAFLSDALFKAEPYMIPMKFNRDAYYNRERALRIGFYETDGLCEPVPACRRAVWDAKAALEKRGHTLIMIEPNFFTQIQKLFMGAAFIDGGAAVHSRLSRDIQDPYHKALYDILAPPWLSLCRKLAAPFMRSYDRQKALAWGSIGLTATDMQNIYIQIEKSREDFFALWKDNNLDAVICPGFISPALTHGLPPRLLCTTGLMNQFTLFDFPAGTVPVTYVTSEDRQILSSSYTPKDSIQYEVMKDSINTQGLPVGVQVAALPNRDELCLRVMREIELSLKS